jgi:hypothetical protein
MPRSECNHEFFANNEIIPTGARNLLTAFEPARPAVAPYQSDGMLGKFAKIFL